MINADWATGSSAAEVGVVGGFAEGGEGGPVGAEGELAGGGAVVGDVGPGGVCVSCWGRVAAGG